MWLIDFLKKKKVVLTDEQKKFNKMWDLWEREQVDSPYLVLMTYYSEINNGGHYQYFTNIENRCDLKKELSNLEMILSKKMKSNLQKSYKAYLKLKEKEDDEEIEEIIENCDNVFYENEEEINKILKEYAFKIELE